MKNVTVLVLFLIFLGLVPVSCDSCGFGNAKKVKNFYIKELGIENVEISTGIKIDTSVYQPFDKLAKGIFIQKTEVASNSQPINRFSFISTVQACDPVPPKAVQTVTKITISSRSNTFYNAAYGQLTSGKNLNDLFWIKYSHQNTPIPLSKLFQEPVGFDYSGGLMLQVSQAPANPVKLTFDLTVTLSDSTKFTFPNQVMKLKP